MYRTAKRLLAGFSVAGILGLTSVSAGTLVDVELLLLVDSSRSIDASQFELQRDGYVAAFKDPIVQSAMFGGPVGAIAASFVYWSGPAQQTTVVGWTLIDDATAADAFADAIGAFIRPFENLTAPGSAINSVYSSFASNDFMGTKNVIDVSGNGRANVGDDTATARDAALMAGIDQVNGLVVLGQPGVGLWYNANIKGGDGSFVLPTLNYGTFGSAIKRKMIREVGQVPVPAAFLLLGTALVGLGSVRRKLT